MTKPTATQAQQIIDEATPAFIAAMTTVMELSDRHGHEHPLVITALALAQELAPPTFQAMMFDEAQDLGLIPEVADGYLADGTPCYRLEDIAARLGIPVAVAQAKFDAMMRQREALGLDTLLIDPATVHRMQ